MSDRDFIEELFSGVEGAVLKRMFGGIGVFCDGVMIAIVIDDEIYFKTDETTRPRFEAEGCTPFTYHRSNGRAVSLSYWRIPQRLIDDSDSFTDWACTARRVAVAAASTGSKTRGRPKAASFDA